MAEEHIVGDWKEFTFEMATEENAGEICENVRKYFLVDETMNKHLGWCEDNAKDHDKMVSIALKHGISFLVRDKETKELAGVQLLIDSSQDGFEKLLTITSPNLHKILNFIKKVEDSTEERFRKEFPCDKYCEIWITSIAHKYRGHGIATEIYNRIPPFLKAKGFTVLRSTFTSPGTQVIGTKLGYVEIGRLRFKDEKDIKGEEIFPGCGEDEWATEVALSF